MDVLITFLGYLLITSGLYALYLLYFNKTILPPIFKKYWMIILASIVCIGIIIGGWMIVVR